MRPDCCSDERTACCPLVTIAACSHLFSGDRLLFTHGNFCTLALAYRRLWLCTIAVDDTVPLCARCADVAFALVQCCAVSIAIMEGAHVVCALLPGNREDSVEFVAGPDGPWMVQTALRHDALRRAPRAQDAQNKNASQTDTARRRRRQQRPPVTGLTGLLRLASPARRVTCASTRRAAPCCALHRMQAERCQYAVCLHVRVRLRYRCRGCSMRHGTVVGGM